jgi:hypothetical protein
MSVVCCQVDVCDGLITGPEETYRLWFVCLIEYPPQKKTDWGCWAMEKKKDMSVRQLTG